VIATAKLVFDTLTPVAAYAALRKAEPAGASFLFESVVGGERWGRRTLVGYRPQRDATLTMEGWTIKDPGGETRVKTSADPLTAAKEIFGERQPRSEFAEDLACAHFGYFAWDLVHAVSRVPTHASLPGPLARFVSGCTLVVFDNLEQTLTVAGPTQADVDRALADLSCAPHLPSFPIPDRTRIPDDVELGMSDAKYASIVLRAKEYIAAGDAFQIVLARTFSVPARGRDPLDVYRALRVINPSPYMYFLDFPPAAGEAKEAGRTQILGASPETLVRLDADVMTVRPIAGTRPRGKTDTEDAALERELLSDPKELAEHVMLIDLGRNDVGRVAEIGSVELVRRMQVERYSHVMHLVSEVRGMQIIRELEAGPRGIYGGAIGYIAPSGDLDFAIAIRTAVCKAGRFEVTAGAGIVEASVPETEAAETWAKARGVLCAVHASGLPVQAGRG
jgi:anthranilate synthase component 1